MKKGSAKPIEKENLRARAPGVRLKAPVDGASELFGRDWLSQHAGYVDMAEVGGRASDDHHRDASSDVVGRDVLLNGKTAEPRQAEVEHDEIRRMLFDAPQRINTVAGFLDVESFDTERHPPYTTERFVVLDN